MHLKFIANTHVHPCIREDYINLHNLQPTHAFANSHDVYSDAPMKIIKKFKGPGSMKDKQQVRAIHFPVHIASRWLCTAITKCTGAPSCMNHMLRCTVYFAPLRRSGRRYGRKNEFPDVNTELVLHFQRDSAVGILG